MTQITLEELTLDNWGHVCQDQFHYLSVGEMIVMLKLIHQLLRLQKQAIKDEAVKMIEEEMKNRGYDELTLSELQDIIRNI